MIHTLPKAITFDCYGTLIDWEAEIQRYFAQKLAEHNITDINARALQGYWEEVQFQSIQGPYLPYRQLLRETMKLAFSSTLRCNSAEILLVLEALLGTCSTPKHPLSHHPEFRILQQDLLCARRLGRLKKQR